MTVAEMYEYTQEVLNKEATSSIFPEEWEILINASQLEKVQNVYYEFEMKQKRMDDLRVLVAPPLSVPNVGQPVAGFERFELPFISNPTSGQSHGYMFMLSVAFKVQYVKNDCEEGISPPIKGRIMRRDKRYELAKNPWLKPSDRRPYYYLSGNDIFLETGTDSYGVEAILEFLRHPTKIELVSGTVDCELPPHMHKEICDLAARKYLEQTESPRHQTLFQDQSTQQN